MPGMPDGCVEYVIGECYWKVEVGECARMADYIRPPRMLSREESTLGKGGEVNWSLGTYLYPAEVEQAFGTTGLTRPWNVAPNQPFPYKGIYFWWLVMLGLVFIVGGPDGLDPALKAEADERYRISGLTLPHAMVRVMLAEALYRAHSLHKGHPYHRE